MIGRMPFNQSKNQIGFESPPETTGQFSKTNISLAITVMAFVFGVMMYVIIDIIHVCVRRCRQPPHSIAAGVNHNEVASNEPDPLYLKQVQTIPVVIYGELPSSMPSSSTSSTEESCSVCLGEYMVGEEVRVLPKCNHMFHRGCIDHWLITRSPFCPICRNCVTDRSQASKVFEMVWSIQRLV